MESTFLSYNAPFGKGAPYKNRLFLYMEEKEKQRLNKLGEAYIRKLKERSSYNREIKGGITWKKK